MLRGSRATLSMCAIVWLVLRQSAVKSLGLTCLKVSRESFHLTCQTSTASLDMSCIVMSLRAWGAAQAPGSVAQAPTTLSTLAEQVLSTMMPNEESILRLAGIATGGSTSGRVPSQGEDPSAPL